jgi:hypothetical protein
MITSTMERQGHARALNIYVVSKYFVNAGGHENGKGIPQWKVVMHRTVTNVTCDRDKVSGIKWKQNNGSQGMGYCAESWGAMAMNADEELRTPMHAIKT